jgi:hypothetical protein
VQLQEFMHMAKTKNAVWLTLLSGGLGVAIFTFVANKAWEMYHHHPVGPEYVESSTRFEGSKLLVFVRNNSDEPLDLKRAQIDIDEPDLVKAEVLGAYPDISKVYTAFASVGSASLDAGDKGLVVTVRIAQAIPPKAADQFGVTLDGLAGPVDLSKVKLRAELVDLKGNKYTVVP